MNVINMYFFEYKYRNIILKQTLYEKKVLYSLTQNHKPFPINIEIIRFFVLLCL